MHCYERKDDMQHKIQVTVLDKKLFKDLQEEYCANPEGDVVHFWCV